MADSGAPRPAENNGTQASSEADSPRVPFTQRMREMDANFRKINHAAEAHRRPNQAAYAKNTTLSQTRTPSSPLSRTGQSTLAVSPTQRNSPQLPPNSLSHTHSAKESIAAPNTMQPYQISSDMLHTSPVPPTLRQTPMSSQISPSQAARDIQQGTRALASSSPRAPISQISSPQASSKSLPTNNAVEPQSSSPRPRINMERSAATGPLTVQDDSKRTSFQPSAPSQLPLDDNRELQLIPVPGSSTMAPRMVPKPQQSQHLQMRPSYPLSHPETQQVQKTDSLTPYKLSPNEHSIPLALNSRVRDQYIGIAKLHDRAITELTQSEAPSEECLLKVQTLIQRLDNLTTHLDLDGNQNPGNPSQTSHEDEANWAETCSFKFQFLRHFFDRIRDQDMHIGIVARPGHLMDIIETFFKARGIVYFRLDGKGAASPNDPRFAHCKCQVSLVPSGPDGFNLAVKPASLVIALDGSVNAQHSQVYRMRVREGRNDLMPLAHLLVYKSAEHVARCLAPHLDPWDRLKKLVSCMAQHRHEVGHLQTEDPDVAAAGMEVAISLELGGQEHQWSLPSIKPITLALSESSQDSSTQEDLQSSMTPEGAVQNPALKRARETEATDSDTVKRQRLSSAGNVSHVNQPSIHSSPIEQLQQHNGFLARENTTLKTQLHQLNVAQQAAREEMATRSRANQDLQARLASHKTHITELEASLSDLQFRYESKNRAYLEAHTNHTNLAAHTDRANKRIEAQTTETATLKETIKALEKEVQEARGWLSGSAIPHISRLAAAQTDARTAQLDNKSLTQKNKNLNADLDFARASYQSASSSAVDLAAELTALKAENESLARRAEGEAARLASANNDKAVEEARRE
ncbi:MAG: hypothetical protein Q9228_003290, partial [Teloschistes exilis]